MAVSVVFYSGNQFVGQYYIWYHALKGGGDRLTKWRKLYERLLHSQTAVSFDDMDHLLRRAGFSVRQPSKGSSHYTYRKGNKRVTIVKHGAELKPVYARLALEALEGEFEEVD